MSNSIKNENLKEKLPKGKGFYIALAVCCTAILAAGWSAYQSVKEISEPVKSAPAKSSSRHKAEQYGKSTKSENKPTSGITQSKSQDKVNSASDKAKTVPSINTSVQAKEDIDEEVKAVSSDSIESLIVYPTNNNVIKEFSDGKPTYSKTLGDWRVHDGVDLKAEKGSLVKSVNSGVVKDIYNDPSYGMTIVIEHDMGFVAYYSGLGDTTLVSKEDRVKTGQDIGSINDVPVEIAEEPHLHFMINKNGKFVDPISVLDKEEE